MDEQVGLFSYGTLQLPAVQQANYGRLLHGISDRLHGYTLRPLTIVDEVVVALSGASVHQIAVPTGNPDDVVTGTLFRISSAEIEATDAYEVAAYQRVEVRLASGADAFVYVDRNAIASASH